ncbi:Gfo/Idh/MocA family protein [Tranquillimonas alkanivorans]|uniref:Predicted dehydrogenase n=1 Tax=Tranquillimonas alkanivorans TaxID=441119 RepID=A0A1I5QAU5_9RHOB|nr:Gfo/Idh/MocA family oxidoreductase [Tranquillimonas alkanivorans]SFP43385.1 Predicted dehydrogenase [Tranquillimonas alkanivorans]
MSGRFFDEYPRLAVVGAGLIGARHVAAIRAAQGVDLACVVDPSDAAAEVATGAAHYRSLDAMFAADRPDGVILATPNSLHAEGALACIARGVPVLVEKPIAADLDGAERMVTAAREAGVALLVGHHRRHNGLVAKAKDIVDSGALGRIAAVHGQTWLRKPEDYFDVAWRGQVGAGPVYVNLIHDVDLLLHLCDRVESVQAMQSNAVRGFEVEDTAAILLRFESGALGTLTVSDTAVAPWSWELTARENPAYPATPEDCYRIAGTEGALALPNLTLWRHDGQASWWEPLSATRYPFELEDPLVRQARHFGAVIRGEETPLVPGEAGLAALRVVEAVKLSAATGRAVDPRTLTADDIRGAQAADRED